MPKGIPKSKEIQEMNDEDLKAMEERTKDVRSPIHEDDFNMPKPTKVFHSADGRAIQQFGVASKAAKIGHQGTLKAFARIEHDYAGWIDMTVEESLEYQNQGILIGYDADRELGLIKQPKRGKNEKVPVNSGTDIN